MCAVRRVDLEIDAINHDGVMGAKVPGAVVVDQHGKTWPVWRDPEELLKLYPAGSQVHLVITENGYQGWVEIPE